ncbi:MAG: sigma-70 family RNA polymerase sigma factor [Alphaproteobacteria bacterium]
MTDTEPSDSELLSRVAAQDRRAIGPLYNRYQPRLYRFLYRMVKDSGMAEELVNEVFLDVWRGAGRFEGRSTPSSWIFSIAHNKAVSALRKRREKPLDEEEAMQIVDPADLQDDVVQHGDMRRLMRGCLDRLSPDHRVVIELTYYQELSVREIAEIVAVPENTVKTRMFHARKRLREMLDASAAGRDGLQ